MLRRKHAFTLIELLVVIAIIALLISILLPALGKARTIARQSLSASNMKQIGAATRTYQVDYKGMVPLFFNWVPRLNKNPYSNRPADWPTWKGISGWMFGGRNCNIRWSKLDLGIFDMPAGRRPLNRYLYTDVSLDEGLPNGNIDPVIRDTIPPLPVFKSPGDRAAYNQPTGALYAFQPNTSGYEDLGTSYLMNLTWYGDFSKGNSRFDSYTGWNQLIPAAQKRFSDGDQQLASRFITYTDQLGDMLANDSKKRNWTGEFGGKNMSMTTFLDGHVDYIEIKTYPTVTTNYYTFDLFSTGSGK